MGYIIEFAPAVRNQLRRLTARERSTLVHAMEKELTHQPLVATRNRKRLRTNDLAAWEMRVGEFRVFYDVVSAPDEMVYVIAVGRKDGNRLIIDDEEVKL